MLRIIVSMFFCKTAENGGNDSSDSPPQRQGVSKKGKKVELFIDRLE